MKKNNNLNFILSFVILLFAFKPVFSGLAYITNEKDNTVSVVDVGKKKVVQTVDVGQRPRGIIMSHDGKFVIIAASDDDRIEVRDAETMKLKFYLSCLKTELIKLAIMKSHLMKNIKISVIHILIGIGI